MCQTCGSSSRSRTSSFIWMHPFAVSTARAKLNWLEKDYTEQLKRLAHAREHANLFIETDELTPEACPPKGVEFSTKDYLS